MEVLNTLDPKKRWQDKLIIGENINQSFQFKATGNSDLALIARSQSEHVSHPKQLLSIPSKLHSPIEQQLVILNRSKQQDQARAFIQYLQSPKAKLLIQQNGYLTKATAKSQLGATDNPIR